MRNASRDPLPLTLLLAALVTTSTARAGGEVTIYRCVATGGNVSLQDQPCPKDAHQIVREMARPREPQRTQQVVLALPSQASTPVHAVNVRDPRPLYECHSNDGQTTYLSQSGIPEQRFVRWPALGNHHLDYDPFADVGRPGAVSVPQTAPHTLHTSSNETPGIYVEDSCERLPQANVCQRLRQRHDELGTLTFNGQPSDRVRYERERQALGEQLQQDCGTD